MNRSMKQMLSALLAVAMVAALLVVPSVAADKLEDGVYKLTADTTPVTVKVGETAEVAASATYKVQEDVSSDIYVTAADTNVATATFAGGKVAITGVAAGTTSVAVAVKGTDLLATIPVTVEAAVDGPTTGIFTLTADDIVAAVKPDADPTVKNGFKPAEGTYTTADKFFTVYGKWNKDNQTHSMEIRPMANWNNPTWSDGYAPVWGLRTGDTGANKTAEVSNGEVVPFISNVVKFTVGAPATVKVWYIQKEAAAVGLYQDNNPTAVIKESITAAEKEAGIVTLNITEPGTYYVGGCTATGEGSKINHVKVVVNIANTPEPAEEKVMNNGVYDLVTDDVVTGLTSGNLAAEGWPTAAGDNKRYTIADGAAPLNAGTDSAFAIYPKAGGSSDIRAAGTTKYDDFAPAWRLAFGGAASLGESLNAPVNAIKFVTGDKATVKIWWAKGGSDERQITILNNQGVSVATTSDELSSGEATVSTLELATKGTYYLGSTVGNNHIYKVEVTVGTVTPPVDPDPEEPTVYTVTADTKVTVTVDSKKTVNVTVDPAGEIYAVSADTSIATVTVANGRVTVTGVKAGKTTVTVGVVDGIGSAEIAVTVNAKSSGGGGSSSNRPSNRPGTNEPATSTLPFTDVKVEDWFYDSVKKAFEKGLMKGTDETTFAPNASTTRAMVATVLFRMDGEKKTDVAGLFNDVEADSWYTDAVAWAAEKGIVLGYDETTFAPNDNVTREQLVVMLYRYAAVTEKSEKDLSAFADAASVSEWATEAMTWAVEKGIILGKGNATLDPQGVASRAEVCTMLVRFLDLK